MDKKIDAEEVFATSFEWRMPDSPTMEKLSVITNDQTYRFMPHSMLPRLDAPISLASFGSNKCAW